MGMFNRGPRVVVPPRQLSAAEVGQVRALTAENKLIHAVKLVRELTGLGLKDAKDIAEAIRDGRHAVPPGAVPPGAVPPGPVPPMTGGADLASRVRALKATGEWHAASALVSAETGMAKSEADRFVAALEG